MNLDDEEDDHKKDVNNDGTGNQMRMKKLSKSGNKKD